MNELYDLVYDFINLTTNKIEGKWRITYDKEGISK
jgi:hypothetical protein